jgi:IclR family acetate operon transcriptional repressor
MGHQQGTGIQSTRNSLAIVETIRDAGGMRVSELADQLNLAKSTVHNHLTTLEEYGYVVNEGGTYHLGLQFLNLGRHARERHRATIPMEKWVESLKEEIDGEIDFVVEEHGRAIQLHHDLDTLNPRTRARMGQFYHLHTTAVGKAILSELPESRLNEIVEQRGLPEQTTNSITSLDELAEELETVREQGYAINDEESSTGLRAVASPILMPNGSVCGALSITGPTYQISVEDLHEMANPLLDVKRRAEADLRAR